MALAAMLVTDLTVAGSEGPAGFACSFVSTKADNPDSHFVDLRAERRSSPEGEQWRLDWADGKSAKAQSFDVKFGSVGRSTGLAWTDVNGAPKRGFVSYTDMVLQNGQEVMFLSLDKPSLWQPPGYVCSTAALKENRQ